MSNTDEVNAALSLIDFAPARTKLVASLDTRDAKIADLTAKLAAVTTAPAPAPTPVPPAPTPTSAGLPSDAKVVLENVTEVSPGVFRSNNLQSLKKASVQITLAQPLKAGQTGTFRFKRKTNIDEAAYKNVNWKTMRAGVAGMDYNRPNVYIGHTPGEGADQLTVEHTFGKSGNGTCGYVGNPTKKDVAQEEVYTFKMNGTNSVIVFSKDGSVVGAFPDTQAGNVAPDLSNCPLQLFIAQAVAESSYTLPAGAYVEFSGFGLTVA